MLEYDTEVAFCLTNSACVLQNAISILNFIQKYLSFWMILTAADVKMTRVGAAMTNTVFIISHEDEHVEPKKMLLRVYGEGVDYILDRKQELDWFAKLSDLGIGPKLYAAFKNGRLEEYVESETLNPTTMREPKISQLIATSLARFHSTVKRDSTSEPEPILFKRLESWSKNSIYAFEALLTENSSSPDLQEIQSLGVMSEDFALETLVNWRNQSAAFVTPLVFSHNDLQHGNILLTAEGNIVLIDYEYGGVNYAAFDIANHFCEWTSDFTERNPHPEVMDFASKYPTEAEMRNFLTAYLSEFYGSEPTLDTIDYWIRAVGHFKFVSNILWGYWGVIQAAKSNIHFNYLGYALCRFKDAVNSFAVLNK